MSMENNLNKFIAELIQEIEQELDETNVTGNIDGYQTPHAFSRKKDKERRKKNATQLGYKLVDDDVDNISEGLVSPKRGHEFFQLTKDTPIKYITKSYTTSSAPGVLWKHDTDYIDGKKGAYLIDYFGAAFYVDLKKKFASKIYPIKDQDKLSWKSNFIDVDKAPQMSDWKKYLNEDMNEGKKLKQVKKDKYGNHLEPQFKKGELVTYLGHPAIITSVNKESGGVYSYNVDYNKGNGRTSARNIFNKSGNELKESVNEAKQKRPVNRWLELKNDDTMHPHKKMAMGLKELKYQLREVEKFFSWYNKIKTMNELDSQNYWKRTNNHIYKIKERLINIAKTIQEIEK